MSAVQVEPLDVFEVPFSRSRTHAAAVEGMLSATEMIRAPHTDIEALRDAQGREWSRLMLEEHLALRASREKKVDVTGVDGVERRSSRDSERHLETVVGTVVAPRIADQAPGSEDLHPMDAALNLPRELFSFGVRRMVAREAARASFEEVVEIVHDHGGAVIAKRQVEEPAVRAAQDFEAFYAQREPVHAPDSDLLVLSTDGKGIVTRHEDLREATRLAAEKKVNKVATRLTPGEKKNRKRTAQVATVYSVALLTGRSGGDVVKTIRWWASRRELAEPALKLIETACNYLADRTRTRLMHYAGVLRDGLPIATGVIEGACRYLVKDRMDRTGARWSVAGAEAILKLRALKVSGSEMMVDATYGTSSFYGSNPYWKDQDYFKFFVSDNPVVPIAMACQQLCTFALLSQGRMIVELTSKGNVRISAGANAYLPWIYDGPWEKSAKYADLATAVKRKAFPERGLTPGSLFGWSPGGEGQQQGSHVACVLRVAASVEKVQFLDTGAVTASAQKIVGGKLRGYSMPRSGLAEDGGSPYSMRNLGVNGNYDDGLFAGQIGVSLAKPPQPIPFVGLGVHKPLSAKVIITGVSLARRARPLGVARLGIIRRSISSGANLDPNAILYVSPTLPMHEGATDNFYISRYLWSLRSMPGYKHLQAIWQIAAPLHAFVNALREPTRDIPLKNVFARATPDLRHWIWLTVENDGRVTYLARYKTETYKDATTGGTGVRDATEPDNVLGRYGALISKLKKLPHGEHYVSPALGALDSIPSYFKPW